MCDTTVVLGSNTKKGNTLFGKNSDREPDETQNIILIPKNYLKTKIEDGKNIEDEKVTVECTYISIPLPTNTYDVILSQPFWMFGGEMGVNQCGVAIGNEAVFTNQPLKKTGLLGMDMIRISLERSNTAKKALENIINLLDTYGQGGYCGYRHKKDNYHNSFIIADFDSAYVLETAGKFWVWKQIENTYNISNQLTIESDYDGIHPDAVSFAIKKGKCSSEQDFSFKKSFIAKGLNMPAILNIGAKGPKRRKLLHEKCLISKTPIDMMNALRSHQLSDDEFTPEKGSMADVCVHSGISLTRPSQSVNSIVAELDSDITTVWTTSGSSPCIQLFRPIVLSAHHENKIPNLLTPGGETPQADFNSKFYPGYTSTKSGNNEKPIIPTWWKNEILHRSVLVDYRRIIQSYRQSRNSIENRFYEELNPRVKSIKDLIKSAISNGSSEHNDKINSQSILSELNSLQLKINEFWSEADKKISEWISNSHEIIKKEGLLEKNRTGFLKKWKKLNEINKLSLNFN